MNKSDIKKIIAGFASATFVASTIVFPNPVAAADQFVNASLQMSTSAPSTAADWTITLEVYNEIPANATITIDPDSTASYEFTLPTFVTTDFDMTIDSVEQTLGATPSGTGTWGVTSTAGTSGTIIFTNNANDTIASGSVIVIEIGTNAASGGAGANQITNPAKEAAAGTADIRDVLVSSNDGSDIDVITFKVPIIESVQNTSSSAPDLTMWILPGDSTQWTGSGVTVSSTAISWGQVIPSTPLVSQLEVGLTTNAQAGFTVYVHQESNDVSGNMVNTENNSYMIDAFTGTNASPAAWTSPTGTTAGSNTAFLGYHTSDTNLVDDVVARFGATGGAAGYATDDLWAGLTTSPQPILAHTGPVNEEACNYSGTGSCTGAGSPVNGEDYTLITLQLETGNLQPSGNYANNLIFTAKPVF